MLVRADVGFDVGAEQVGVVAVFRPVRRVGVAVVDLRRERLFGPNRVMDLMQRRRRRVVRGRGCGAEGETSRRQRRCRQHAQQRPGPHAISRKPHFRDPKTLFPQPVWNRRSDWYEFGQSRCARSSQSPRSCPLTHREATGAATGFVIARRRVSTSSGVAAVCLPGEASSTTTQRGFP